MTKADLPSFHVEEGQRYGVWKVTLFVPPNSIWIECVDCGLEFCVNRRNLIRSSKQICHRWGRHSFFSKHFNTTSERDAWLKKHREGIVTD